MNVQETKRYVVEKILTEAIDFTDAFLPTTPTFGSRGDASADVRRALVRCYPWRAGETYVLVNVHVAQVVAGSPATCEMKVEKVLVVRRGADNRALGILTAHPPQGLPV